MLQLIITCFYDPCLQLRKYTGGHHEKPKT